MGEVTGAVGWNGRSYPKIVELIGDTPMVRIRRVCRDIVSPDVRIFAKLEGFNPAGSVKDRPAWNMIRRGLESGALSPGKTIIDSTSGNTGSVLQRSQSRGPLPDHRSGDLAADRRRDHALRRLDRYRRHDHGHRKILEVA